MHLRAFWICCQAISDQIGLDEIQPNLQAFMAGLTSSRALNFDLVLGLARIITRADEVGSN